MLHLQHTRMRAKNKRASVETESVVTGATTLLRNEPVQARSNARLTSLLDAAAAAIDAVGYERLTTAMVAERAGASIGTVYRYFPDRIAVLQSVAARSIDRFNDRVDEVFATQKFDSWWHVFDTFLSEGVNAMANEPAYAALDSAMSWICVHGKTPQPAAGLSRHILGRYWSPTMGYPTGTTSTSIWKSPSRLLTRCLPVLSGSSRTAISPTLTKLEYRQEATW